MTTPLVSAAKELFERAAKLAGDNDMSAIATLYEEEPTVQRES